jgi:hypothetical protein
MCFGGMRASTNSVHFPILAVRLQHRPRAQCTNPHARRSIQEILRPDFHECLHSASDKDQQQRSSRRSTAHAAAQKLPRDAKPTEEDTGQQTQASTLPTRRERACLQVALPARDDLIGAETRIDACKTAEHTRGAHDERARHARTQRQTRHEPRAMLEAHAPFRSVSVPAIRSIQYRGTAAAALLASSPGAARA